MRRRDVLMALTTAVVAGLLVVLGSGVMVMLGLRTGSGTRDHFSKATTNARSPIATSGSRVPSHVPVLCYHFIRNPGGPLHFARVFGYVVLSLPLLNESQLWNVSVGGFERQMEYLKDRGYETVSLDDVHEWQLGRRSLPAKSVVITFDDGDVSAHDLALPILQRLGLRATLFLVTARVGARWGDVRCLDWDTIRAMRRSRVFDIQSHTDDLHYKVNRQGDVLPVFIAASERGYPLNEDEDWHAVVLRDLARSRLAIQLNVGRAPSYLAWPYGFGNPALDRIAVEAGFRRTCALRASSNEPLAPDETLRVADPQHFEMPRYAVTARTSLRDFRAMLEGTYHPGR